MKSLSIYKVRTIPTLNLVGRVMKPQLDFSYMVKEIVYLSAPYSLIRHKDKLMQRLQKFAADYMVANPGSYTITGLMHHYACEQNPDLGTNYLFWSNFCEWLIDKSDRVIVLKFPDWEFSTGVLGEIDYAHTKGIPVEYRTI